MRYIFLTLALFFALMVQANAATRNRARDIPCNVVSTCEATMNITVNAIYNCGANEKSDAFYCERDGECCPWNIEPAAGEPDEEGNVNYE